MTDMNYNSISVLEWIVSVWIIGDIIEEIFNLVRENESTLHNLAAILIHNAQSAIPKHY